MKHKKTYLSKSGLPMLALALALSGSILLPDAIPHDSQVSHSFPIGEYSSQQKEETEEDSGIRPMSDLDELKQLGK